MATNIVNAAAMEQPLGTQDLSTRKVPRTPKARPTFCPKFYIWGQKGPSGPVLVDAVDRVNIYGEKSFDLRSKYANHATIFANGAAAEGTTCMLERVFAPDVGPKANVGVWLDVLETTVDIYARNIDGSIKLDAAGSPVITGTSKGYKVKIVSTVRDTHTLSQAFGTSTIKPGSQVDPVTSTQSQRYPLWEKEVSSEGEFGNNVGFRMWGPTAAGNQAIPTKMMAQQRAFPYFISMVSRTDARTSPKVTESIYGEQYTMVTLKEEVIDPLTEKPLYMGDILLDSYSSLSDPKYAAIYGDFGRMAIYQDNIDALVKKFHAAEVPFIDSFSDFSSDPADMHLFNLLGGTSSQGVPYHTYQFVDDVDAIRLTEYTNIYAGGGSDGTMTDEIFADLVTEKLADYLNPNALVQAVAKNVESVFIDSGFPLKTKRAIAGFQAIRKNTAVILGTYEVGERALVQSEEHSVATVLRSALQMYPESEYFGTPVMRGIIIGGSGKVRNSLYKGRLPLTYEIMMKSCRYMGAANGIWKGEYRFDSAPLNVLEFMYDIAIPWIPNSVKNRSWDVGLNWVEYYDTDTFMFPALKTVYPDDTSVLNSYFTMLGICELNSVVSAAWREFTGVDHLTNAQLTKEVNNYITQNTKGRFDNRFVIVPEAFFTDMDLLRGYSWTVPTKLYANNMKTVMTSYPQAMRMSDLTT